MTSTKPIAGSFVLIGTNRKSNFSMIAEIGGYSGLLLGFSLIDMVIVFEYLALFFKRAFNFFLKINHV